jgi:hypothetical protein
VRQQKKKQKPRCRYNIVSPPRLWNYWQFARASAQLALNANRSISRAWLRRCAKRKRPLFSTGMKIDKKWLRHMSHHNILNAPEMKKGFCRAIEVKAD